MQIKIQSLAELAAIEAESLSLISERSFRRGYHHGYIAAVEDVMVSFFLGKKKLNRIMWHFIENDIYHWRYNITDTNINPPMFPVKCVYCGARAESMDHVIPRSRGGKNDRNNLLPACTKCNSSKNDKTPAEWGEEINEELVMVWQELASLKD